MMSIIFKFQQESFKKNCVEEALRFGSVISVAVYINLLKTKKHDGSVLQMK